MILSKLVVKTGTFCSLKCEKCGEFNPYLAAKGKTFCADMLQLANDIKAIANVVEKIELIDIAGGEALTHTNLDILIGEIVEVSNIDMIHIVSNGTIIPNEKIMSLLENNKDKLKITISDYTSAGVDNSKVIQKLKDTGVSYSVIRDMVWVDKSDCSYKGYKKDEILSMCEKCVTYKKFPYFTLINGKLSAHCPTAGSLMYYLDLYDECKGEYIDLREIEELTEGDMQKLNDNVTLVPCNYCVPSYLAKKCEAGKQLS